MSATMKRCITCQADRALAEFYPNVSAKDRLRGECKECFKAKTRERYHRKKAELNKPRYPGGEH